MFRIPSLLSGSRRFRPRHADPDPAALAAGQLRNKVQAVLPRPRHPLRSQPGATDGNSSVSRRQQITFGATLIFHLIDGLLSTTAAHEVRRAGVLNFSHAGPATWNALPNHIRTVADPVKFQKLLKSLYFSQDLTFVDFCVSLCVLASG